MPYPAQILDDSANHLIIGLAAVFEQDQAVAVSYRAPPGLLDKVNAVTKHFHGTRNYHNFTSGYFSRPET